MTYRGMLFAGAAAMALSAPAFAQSEEGQAEAQSQGQGEGQGITVDIVPATQWTYDEAYEGWSAEELVEEADVYNEDGEEIGELEDLIVTSDGRISRLVIESGGFLDIGDATFAYPADQARIEGMDEIVLPIEADTEIGEDYSLFAGQPIEEGEPVSGSDWRISQLLNDYAYLGGGVPYGWVRDVIINPDTMTIAAVVVSPDVGYGAPGMYAFPYYDYRAGYDMQADIYEVPYTAEEIGELDIFVYPQAGGEMEEGADQG